MSIFVIAGTAIEVKCPFSESVRFTGAFKSLGTKDSYFDTLKFDNNENAVVVVKEIVKVDDQTVYILSPDCVALKKTGQGKKFYSQVQGNIFLSGLAECDFVVWTPKETVVLRIFRDERWGSEVLPKLLDVFREFAGVLFVSQQRT